MTDWYVGQKVIVVVPLKDQVRISEHEITKIGRVWATLKSEWGSRVRFNINTGEMDGYFNGNERVYRDHAAYQAYAELVVAWKEFHNAVRNQYQPPPHLTADRVRQMHHTILNIAGGVDFSPRAADEDTL